MKKDLTIDRLGPLGGIGWLVRTKRSAVLIDTGFPYYGKTMAAELLSRLSGLPLTDILITHSHYDHAGGLAKIKEAFPAAIVSAAARTKKILCRESALNAMRALNRTAAMEAGAPATDDSEVGAYEIDRVVCDKDQIITQDFVIEVWETPGHTADSLSFWFPEESLAALSETTGLFSNDLSYVEPAFIVSWKGAINALDRIEAAMPHALIIPHAGILTDKNAAAFLRRQREEILFVKDLVFSLTAEGKTEDEIVQVLQFRYHDKRPYPMKGSQPLDAFLINFKAMISRTLEEGA